MGDKSPKAKQKNKTQKDAASATAKNEKDRRQQTFAARSGKDPKK